MLTGYARVSTDDQNLDLQRDAFRAPVANAFLKAASAVRRQCEAGAHRLDGLAWDGAPGRYRSHLAAGSPGSLLEGYDSIGRTLGGRWRWPEKFAGKYRHLVQWRQAGVPFIEPARGTPTLLFSVVDDRSGLCYQEDRCVYGENAESVLRFPFNAMVPKPFMPGFPFERRPKMIYMDNAPVAKSRVFHVELVLSRQIDDLEPTLKRMGFGMHFSCK